jgi:hypothetical protein
LDALEPLLEDDSLVGLVAALDGKIISAEIYGDSRLFNASGKDMIRALSLDALSRPQGQSGEVKVNVEQAASFLLKAMNAPEIAESTGLGHRARRHSAEADAFETKDEQGGLLHLNVYAH